jgi:hypothetical protein
MQEQEHELRATIRSGPISVRTHAKGNVEYGVTFKDGDLVPNNKHSYSRDGQFEKKTEIIRTPFPDRLRLVSHLTLSTVLYDRQTQAHKLPPQWPAARDGGLGDFVASFGPPGLAITQRS